jgi:phosphoribosyl-ATP pyrophosphohydrolase
MTQHIIDEIFDTIEARKNAHKDTSYVASLFAKGTNKIAEKVSEETTEVIIEAVQGNKENLAQESADLLFHLMVLWSDAGLKPEDIFDVLKQRQGISGIEEKKLRQ